jgi:hypothetical protein
MRALARGARLVRMGFLLYGGLGLLPLWLLIAYALLSQGGAHGEPSDAVLWWSVGAVPACFMTLAFAEALMLTRERRPDPWRQHKILAIVVPMIVLLFAGGMKWEEQQAALRAEQQRPAVAAPPGRDQAGLRASRNSSEPDPATSARMVNPTR